MTDAPVANRSNILQLAIRDDALADVAECFLKVANRVLLQDKRLQHSIEREEMAPAAYFAFEAREGFNSGLGLAQGFQ
jgi:hypothetical protein